MWRWRYNSLTVRLTTALVVIIGLLIAGAVSVQRALQERGADELARQNGLSLSDTVYGALQNSMLMNDGFGVDNTIRSIAARSSDVLIRIFDKQGKVAYSSVPDEVGRTFDTGARFCRRCHEKAPPIDRLDATRRTQFINLAGVRTLGIIRPIENERACSTASCHAHEPDRHLLGLLAVEVSMASSDREQQHTGRLMTAVGVGAIVVISVVVLLLMRNELHRPIHALVNTLDALGRQDYSARFVGTERTELAFVGAAINRMAQELDRANAELLRWAQTLERRVDEKTAELKIAQERVLRVERMASLGKLAAVVAHEINNPLASVLTYSRLLVRRAESPTKGLVVGDDTREILDAIASESARCGAIVSNLLLFTRSGGGAQPTSLNDVTKRVLFLLKHKMDLAKVEAVTDLKADLPTLECDPGQIEQALLALCVNAIEAMPTGGTLTIRSTVVQPAAIEIVIRDTGVGIPAEVLAHVFEPFFSTKSEGGFTGLGLGLAVVDGIVNKYHGRIAVTSDPGQGTSFTLTFPLPAAATQEGTG